MSTNMSNLTDDIDFSKLQEELAEHSTTVDASSPDYKVWGALPPLTDRQIQDINDETKQEDIVKQIFEGERDFLYSLIRKKQVDEFRVAVETYRAYIKRTRGAAANGFDLPWDLRTFIATWEEQQQLERCLVTANEILPLYVREPIGITASLISAASSVKCNDAIAIILALQLNHTNYVKSGYLLAPPIFDVANILHLTNAGFNDLAYQIVCQFDLCQFGSLEFAELQFTHSYEGETQQVIGEVTETLVDTTLDADAKFEKVRGLLGDYYKKHHHIPFLPGTAAPVTENKIFISRKKGEAAGVPAAASATSSATAISAQEGQPDQELTNEEQKELEKQKLIKAGLAANQAAMANIRPDDSSKAKPIRFYTPSTDIYRLITGTVPNAVKAAATTEMSDAPVATTSKYTITDDKVLLQALQILTASIYELTAQFPTKTFLFKGALEFATSKSASWMCSTWFSARNLKRKQLGDWLTEQNLTLPLAYPFPFNVSLLVKMIEYADVKNMPEDIKYEDVVEKVFAGLGDNDVDDAFSAKYRNIIQYSTPGQSSLQEVDNLLRTAWRLPHQDAGDILLATPQVHKLIRLSPNPPLRKPWFYQQIKIQTSWRGTLPQPGPNGAKLVNTLFPLNQGQEYGYDLLTVIAHILQPIQANTLMWLANLYRIAETKDGVCPKSPQLNAQINKKLQDVKTRIGNSKILFPLDPEDPDAKSAQIPHIPTRLAEYAAAYAVLAKPEMFQQYVKSHGQHWHELFIMMYAVVLGTAYQTMAEPDFQLDCAGDPTKRLVTQKIFRIAGEDKPPAQNADFLRVQTELIVFQKEATKLGQAAIAKLPADATIHQKRQAFLQFFAPERLLQGDVAPNWKSATAAHNCTKAVEDTYRFLRFIDAKSETYPPIPC